MKMKKIILPLIILIVFLGCSSTDHNAINTYTGPIADNAMVVSAHPLASEVGVQILKAGGNAIDAAIAVQFALAVVYPRAGNIGGGGFMVVRFPDGSTNSLDFREAAPLKASRDMYLDSAGKVIDNMSTLGHLAAGVPGTVDGMVKAHEKYGSLPWEKLVQPAILLAFNGFELTDRDVEDLNRLRKTFEAVNTVYPENLLSNWAIGDKIKHLYLTATLTRIRDEGRDGFYAGETADLLIAEMERGGGIISYEDLKSYQAKWRPALEGSYRGHKIITMPPVSSGGVALLQLLSMVEPYKLKKMGHNSADYVHLLVEAERRVYADRAEYLGDPEFYEVPVAELLNKSYLEQRMQSFNKKQATPSEEISHGVVRSESDQTTHFSIVDKKGMAVSVTTTLNGSFGNKVVVGNAGFILNNEMDDFSIKPGVPNMFGLIGGEANAIEPSKRMLSSMTPTIVEKDGEVLFVTGTPGGSTIITSVFQSILNVIDFEMSALAAVSAPRFHSQWKPDVVMIEPDAIDEKTHEKLSAKGHELSIRDKIGAVDAILRLPNGKLEGGADPRRFDDKAIGY